ncbi:hypothetical protein [Pararhodobacter zhoushanensis]|uniref:hypothetical protein n=1 Tax=Pararhodobacter zhoushanensis TaxID=2479545 RepID=UPI000F8E1C7F|nr:hypothetical protein [Pararhodobacter zhoushanensis]
MSAERKALREDLRVAVAAVMAGNPTWAGKSIISAWTTNLSPDALPVIGVATPTEERDAAAQDTDFQTFVAVVVVKRAHKGGDGTELEDTLDDDAEALVGPIEAGVQAQGRDFALRSSAIEISGEGSPRIGTLTLTFGATTTRARILPL